jgi:hypothetical protein
MFSWANQTPRLNARIAASKATAGKMGKWPPGAYTRRAAGEKLPTDDAQLSAGEEHPKAVVGRAQEPLPLNYLYENTLRGVSG